MLFQLSTITLLAILATIAILTVSLISPSVGLFWLKREKTRSNALRYYGIVIVGMFVNLIFLSILGVGLDSTSANQEGDYQNVDSTIQHENYQTKSDTLALKKSSKEETSYQLSVPDFSVLRSWQPDGDNSAVGLDILIDKSNLDVSEILRLIKRLNKPDKVVILVYASREAWQEDQSRSYSVEHKKSYIAFYVKNYTTSGPYRGINEIRWMQEIGVLDHLYGSKREL